MRPPPPPRRTRSGLCARCGEPAKLGGFVFSHASWERETRFCSIRCLMSELGPVADLTEEQFVEFVRATRTRPPVRGRDWWPHLSRGPPDYPARPPDPERGRDWRERDDEYWRERERDPRRRRGWK